MGIYYVLCSTNVARPLADWPRLLTNAFDSGGDFTLAIPLAPASPQSFYLLQLP